MKTTIALLSVMALAGSLSFGREAPVGAPKGPRGPAKERPNPGELFNKLDTSGDGQVSLEEFKAGPMGQRLGDKAGEVFNKIDTDSSGGISLEEFKAHRPPGGDRPPGDRPNPGEIFKKLDTSGDGQVSLEEFKAGPMGQRLGDKAGEVFNKIDADSSGGITMEEFKAFRPERRGKGGPGRPGRPGRPGGDLEPPPAPVE
jgi:Ca2+-binding EF-hand superfamily protein